MSLIVLEVCLLAGSTYAWFETSAYSENSNINSGFLGIDILTTDEYLDVLGYEEDSSHPLKEYTRNVLVSNGVSTHEESETYKIITNTDVPLLKLYNVEPGQAFPVEFKVLNRGDLAAAYTADFDIVDSLTGLETLEKESSEGGFVLKYVEDEAHIIDNREKLPSELREWADTIDEDTLQNKATILNKEQRDVHGENIGGHLEDVLEVYLGDSLEDINEANKIGTITDIVEGNANIFDGYILPIATIKDENDKINPAEVILYDDEGNSTGSRTNVTELGDLSLIIYMPESVSNLYKYASISLKVGVKASQTEFEYDGLHCMIYDRYASPRRQEGSDSSYFNLKNKGLTDSYVGLITKTTDEDAQPISGIEYSLDLLNWENMPSTIYDESIPNVDYLPNFIRVPGGKSIYFRCQSRRRYFSVGTNLYHIFKILDAEGNSAGNFSASGNINFLVDTVASPAGYDNYIFYGLFKECDALTDASAISMPQTELSKFCYAYMFSGCVNLAKGPVVNGVYLEEGCYKAMFENCTSLTSCPQLTSMNLAPYCYNMMFSNCDSIGEPPALPADVMKESCYESMFKNCSNLSSMPALNSETLAKYCYYYMFAGCTSLKEVGDLPATILYEGCYKSMFENCTKIPMFPTGYELPATQLVKECYCSMFFGCSELGETPHIKATSFAESSLKNMFSGCQQLSEVTIDSLDWGDDLLEPFTTWLYNVKSTGTFHCKSSLPERRGPNGIPNNWTIVRS